MNLVLLGSTVFVAELVLAFGLSALARLGRAGRAIHEALCRAPLLDVVWATMTLVPGAIGLAVASWPGLLVALAAQAIALVVWVRLHELLHRKAARGLRLVRDC